MHRINLIKINLGTTPEVGGGGGGGGDLIKLKGGK